MTSTDFWNDRDMFPSGDFVRFEAIGDSVEGVITAMRRHVFDDGKVAPQLELDTDDGPRTLTAGQIRLKAELAERRPQVGDHLTVTLIGIEKRPGGKTMKEFRVTVGAPPTVTHPPTATLAAQIKADKARLASRLAAQPRTPNTADAPF